MYDPIVYLNGDYLPRSQAKISVLDRGFLFADGVYEVIPIYHGVILGCDEHLVRLNHSLQEIQLTSPLQYQQWLNIFAKLSEQYPDYQQRDYSIYLQVSRGADNERQHPFPDTSVKPTIFAQITPSKTIALEKLQRGLTAITLDDIRWHWCHIKSVSLLPNILQREIAKQQGVEEAILLRDNYVTEGTSSNVFIIKQGTILTPPEQGQILGGITRKLVLQLAKQYQLPHAETMISKQELHQADEIWITNSSKDVAPIVTLDGKTVGNGKAGLLWGKMYHYFQTYKKNL